MGPVELHVRESRCLPIISVCECPATVDARRVARQVLCHRRRHSGRIGGVGDRVAEDLPKHRKLASDHRNPCGQGLHGRQSEPLLGGEERNQRGSGDECGQRVVGDRAEDDGPDAQFGCARVESSPVLAVVEEGFTAREDEAQLGVVAAEQRESLQQIDTALARFDATQRQNVGTEASLPAATGGRCGDRIACGGVESVVLDAVGDQTGRRFQPA